MESFCVWNENLVRLPLQPVRIFWSRKEKYSIGETGPIEQSRRRFLVVRVHGRTDGNK